MMCHKIAVNHALAQVYLALDKLVLRRKWLQVVAGGYGKLAVSQIS